MDYSTMPAGREMDALVAEKVMGLVPCQAESHTPGHSLYMPRPCHAQPGSPDMGGETPMYSTSISAAWEVVEKFQEVEIVHEYGGTTRCEVMVAGGECFSSNAPTAPLAICRAALLAAGKE